MAVNGYGEHVVPIIEYLLLPVPMVMVDVEDGNPPVPAQIMRRHGSGVEVTEPSERTHLSMVARRPYKGIGQMESFQERLRGGQCAIHPPARCQKGIPVQWREGVDTVVARTDGQHFGRPSRIPYGENIRVYGDAGLQGKTHIFEIFHIGLIVDIGNRALGKPFGAELDEKIRLVELLENRTYPHR